jgi:transcription-repair coupling factor (superfamily II helicase)
MPTLLHPPLPSDAESPWRWRGLHGSARALALAEAVGADTRPWVFVAADTRELERLAGELRFFGGAALEILTLPDWEVLPYDVFSPHPDIVSERLRTLSRLPLLARGILLLSADSLLTRLPPVSYVQARSFELKTGAPLAIEPLRLRLAAAGYASVSQVTGPGEFALRGSLFDVFPMGSEVPVRVDLLDDRIDSIRRFDPDTQRSLEGIEQLRIAAGARTAARCRGGQGFRRRYRARFEGDVTRMPIYRGVSEGIAPPGIEFYLPLFFEATARITDYLPPQLVVASDCDIGTALEVAWEGIAARYEDRRHDIERPLLPPAEAFIEPAAVTGALAAHPSGRHRALCRPR